MADRSYLCVKGVVIAYNVYKDDWTPDIGDGLDGRIEKENCFDQYSIAVIIRDNVVGHVAREISKGKQITNCLTPFYSK